MRVVLLLSLLAAIPAQADPEVDYLLHCSGCHMPDGTGLEGIVPTLHGVIGRMAASKAGREYLIRVPGVAQAPVSDATLAAILNWTLVEFSPNTLPDDFEPITAEEVASARARLLPDPLKLRAELFPDY